MIGRLGSRIFELIVLVFALYAFVFVPLGKRTGLEHVKAILGTSEAKEAGEEFVEAGDRLKRQVLGAGGAAPIRGKPVLPELPQGAPVQMRVAPVGGETLAAQRRGVPTGVGAVPNPRRVPTGVGSAPEPRRVPTRVGSAPDAGADASLVE